MDTQAYKKVNELLQSFIAESLLTGFKEFSTTIKAYELETPYAVVGGFYYYFSGLVASDRAEDQTKAREILQFINEIMNGKEHDDEVKNMVYLEFIEMLLGSVGPDGKDLDDAFEHKKMKLAKQCFTGEALYWLRYAVEHSNDAYRSKFPYVFED